LRKLESQFGGFNIFESIGAVRRELRHSDFLAFLLDPSANHQLFDRFIKPFLFRIAEKTESVSVIDIDLLNYDDIQIRREWKSIDVLIISEKSEFVCAIENKIDAGESDGQLNAYHDHIKNHYGKFNNKLLLFLTPEGIESSDTNNWISVSYSEVFDTLNQLLKEHKESLGHDIQFAISQYKEIIERHIMTDTKITKLCQDIYKEHKQALDLIFENRPDLQMEMKEFLISEIEGYANGNEVNNITKDDCNKTYIRFSVNSWDLDKSPFMKCTQEKWTTSHQVLLFEIVNTPNRIVVDLVIGPSDNENRKFRENVFKSIKESGNLNTNIKKLAKNFCHATQYSLTNKKIDFDNVEEVKKEVSRKLNIFLNSDDKGMMKDIVSNINVVIERFSSNGEK
jgi:hypothetical protein